MSVSNVYSKTVKDGPSVDGYVHGDGSKTVLLAILPSAVAITLHVHWTPAMARDVAAMLVAAADASEAAGAPERPCPVQGCGRSVGDCPHAEGLTLGTVR